MQSICEERSNPVRSWELGLFYVIPALQMLILTASALQMRKNGGETLATADKHRRIRLCNGEFYELCEFFIVAICVPANALSMACAMRV